MSSAALPDPPTGALVAKEREALLQLLASSREALINATTGVSQQQAAFRPRPGVWSIIDCVEHLAVSEAAILSMVINEIMHSPPDLNCLRKTEGKTELVKNVMRDRTEKRKTFAYLEPEERWTSLGEALTAFQQNRQRSIDYVRTTDAPLHLHAAALGALGDLSGYQWLVMMASHTERHVSQIEDLINEQSTTARLD